MKTVNDPNVFYQLFLRPLGQRLDLSALELKVTGALGNAENADGVGATALCPPSLQCDDNVALLNDAEVERLSETVLDTVVDVLLPLGIVLGAGVGVEERVAAAVQVHVAGSVWVAGNCEDRARWAVLADKRAVTPVVDMSKMAPACCSSEAATAAIAMVSLVSVGIEVKVRISLKRGTYETLCSARYAVSAIILTASMG